MAQVLGLSILSLFITFTLIVPFIDFLYKVKLRRQKQKTVDIFDKPTPVFDMYNDWKAGTPFGGGILILIVVTLLTLWSYGLLGIEVNAWEFFVIMLGFIGFGILVFYDDLKKLVPPDKADFF